MSRRGFKSKNPCLHITITPITATTRKLRVKWSAELAEDIVAFKGMNGNAEIKFK